MTNGLGMLSSRDNVLYLPFKEGSGSTAYDYSGQGNDGTITGATYKKIVDGGYALEQDVADYVTMTPGFITSGVPFTIMSWINITSSTTHSSGQWIHGFRSDIQFFTRVLESTDATNPDKVECYVLSGSTTTRSYSDSTFPYGEWVHLAFVCNGTNVKMYINTILQSDIVNNGYPNSVNTGNSNLGAANNDTAGMAGMFGNTILMERALSLAEIQAIYRATYIL